jgi:hypothetical protein
MVQKALISDFWYDVGGWVCLVSFLLLAGQLTLLAQQHPILVPASRQPAAGSPSVFRGSTALACSLACGAPLHQ